MKRWQNFKRFLNETFIWKTYVMLAYNTLIGVPMTIQLLNKQGNNYRLNIYGCECVFKPMELFTTGLFPVKKCIVNGSLGWYVNRKFVSYRKIKKVLKCNN